MKKLVALLSALTLSLTLALFFGCGDGASALTGTATVVLDRGEGNGENRYEEFTLDLGEAGLTSANHAIDVLDALETGGSFYYESSEGSYGVMLTEMGRMADLSGVGAAEAVLKPGEREYISVYTSNAEESNPDADSYGGTITYEGINVYYAMLGVSSLSVFDGAVYYFFVDSY